MSIAFIIIGILLVFFGSRRKKANGKTLAQVADQLKGERPETAILTGFKYGFKAYLKIMAIAFGIVFILCGLIFMAI